MDLFTRHKKFRERLIKERQELLMNSLKEVNITEETEEKFTKERVLIGHYFDITYRSSEDRKAVIKFLCEEQIEELLTGCYTAEIVRSEKHLMYLKGKEIKE